MIFMIINIDEYILERYLNMYNPFFSRDMCKHKLFDELVHLICVFKSGLFIEIKYVCIYLTYTTIAKYLLFFKSYSVFSSI